MKTRSSSLEYQHEQCALAEKQVAQKFRAKHCLTIGFDALMQKTDHVIRVVNMTIAVIATFSKVGSPSSRSFMEPRCSRAGAAHDRLGWHDSLILEAMPKSKLNQKQQLPLAIVTIDYSISLHHS